MARREGKPKTFQLRLYPATKDAGNDNGTNVGGHLDTDPNSETDRRAEEVRKSKLLKDDRCEQVEPFRLLCKTCLSFIPLDSKEKYSVSSWELHISKCTGRFVVFKQFFPLKLTRAFKGGPPLLVWKMKMTTMNSIQASPAQRSLMETIERKC